MFDRLFTLAAAAAVTGAAAFTYTGVIDFAQESSSAAQLELLGQYSYTYGLMAGGVDAGARAVAEDTFGAPTSPDTWIVDGSLRVEYDATTDTFRAVIGDHCHEAVVGKTPNPAVVACAPGTFEPQGPTADELADAATGIADAATEGQLPIELTDGFLAFTGEDGTCFNARVVDGQLTDVTPC